MSEAAPAPEIRYETDAEPPLWLEKPLPETPMSKEPLSAMEEWFPTSSYQDIQLPARKTSAAAIPATSRCKISSQPLVKQEGPLPERSAVESLESLALAFGGWPTPTSKPATLSEPPHPIDDRRVSKESNYQEPMKRSQISLAKSSTRAEIRNFSRPLGTPRAPLEFSQLPLPNVSRPPKLVGSSRFPQGGFVSPAVGDVATASNQLSSVNGGRLEGSTRTQHYGKKETMMIRGRKRGLAPGAS